MLDGRMLWRRPGGTAWCLVRDRCVARRERRVARGHRTRERRQELERMWFGERRHDGELFVRG